MKKVLASIGVVLLVGISAYLIMSSQQVLTLRQNWQRMPPITAVIAFGLDKP